MRALLLPLQGAGVAALSVSRASTGVHLDRRAFGSAAAAAISAAALLAARLGLAVLKLLVLAKLRTCPRLSPRFFST